MAQHHTNQRQRGNAALQQAALSALPLQSSLQVSRKLDCTKPPIKDARLALPCTAKDTNAATPAAAAAPANAAWGANAALQPPEKITCLTPAGGVESPLIAPADGVESTATAPGRCCINNEPVLCRLGA